MTFEPKQKNKVPEVAVLCLFITAGVAFGFSAIELIPGRGMLQMLALVLFCAMIFIAVRYKFTYFRYSVRRAVMKSHSLHHEDDEDDGDREVQPAEVYPEDAPVTSLPPHMFELCVERRQGNGKWSAECILRLNEIEECLCLPEESGRVKDLLAKNKRMPKYKYFRNLSVPAQTVIKANTPSGRVIVYIETEKKLTEYLRAVAEYNKGI